MPNRKIIDQYTDRTDLTREQKWVLRNPEKRRQIVRNSRAKLLLKDPDYNRRMNRKWKENNPEKAYSLQLKHNNLAKHRAIVKKTEYALFKDFGRNKLKEASDLLKRGKDVASVAIWLKIPSSIVNQLAQNLTTTDKHTE